MCIIRYGGGVITAGSDAHAVRCASRLVTGAVLGVICVICVMMLMLMKVLMMRRRRRRRRNKGATPPPQKNPRFHSTRNAECTGLKSIWKRPGGCGTMQSNT